MPVIPEEAPSYLPRTYAEYAQLCDRRYDLMRLHQSLLRQEAAYDLKYGEGAFRRNNITFGGSLRDVEEKLDVLADADVWHLELGRDFPDDVTPTAANDIQNEVDTFSVEPTGEAEGSASRRAELLKKVAPSDSWLIDLTLLQINIMLALDGFSDERGNRFASGSKDFGRIARELPDKINDWEGDGADAHSTLSNSIRQQAAQISDTDKVLRHALYEHNERVNITRAVLISWDSFLSLFRLTWMAHTLAGQLVVCVPALTVCNAFQGKLGEHSRATAASVRVQISAYDRVASGAASVAASHAASTSEIGCSVSAPVAEGPQSEGLAPQPLVRHRQHDASQLAPALGKSTELHTSNSIPDRTGDSAPVFAGEYRSPWRQPAQGDSPTLEDAASRHRTSEPVPPLIIGTPPQGQGRARQSVGLPPDARPGHVPLEPAGPPTFHRSAPPVAAAPNLDSSQFEVSIGATSGARAPTGAVRAAAGDVAAYPQESSGPQTQLKP